MYKPRTLTPVLEAISRSFQAVLITGPRQVGKTTLLRHSGDRSYVTLDNPDDLLLAKTEPRVFLEKYPRPILIDEIQYAPGLLPYVKMEADENRKPGDFWLTGSQQFHMMKGVSESLAGRVGIMHLQGFSRREADGRPQESVPFFPTESAIESGFATGGRLLLPDLYERIWMGGYPKVVLQPGSEKDRYFAAYLATYLQRDIRDLARVGDETDFLKFMRAAAARTGQLLNLADLARDTGISPPTAKTWLSILVSSGIVYLLERWFTNLTKRIVKTPKLYFLDTGLCTYLTKWSDPATLEAGAMSGAILETWILSEMVKGFWHNGREAPFYFYRDKEKAEIDLLIEQNGMLYPMEFKKTGSPRKEDIRHFGALEKLGLPIGPGGIVCLTDRPRPLAEKAWSIPISAL